MPEAALSKLQFPAVSGLAGGRVGQVLPWVLLLLGAVMPLVLSGYELSLLGRFMALGILAMGLVLIWGHGGILSLGQGVFFGIGAYAIAMHMKMAPLGEGQLPDFMIWTGREELPFWWVPLGSPVLAVLAVLIVPTLFAALFSWLVFHRRVSGVYFALITQALALAFATLLISAQDVTGGFNGLTNFQTLFGFYLADPWTVSGLYWATLIIAAAGYAGLRWLLASRYGTLLRATRDGENRVRFLGYNPVPFKVIAFAIAGMLAGLSGALFTLHSGNISPALVGVVPSIEMVIWVAVGGRISLPGALAAAVVVNLVRDMVSSSFPDLWLYCIGLLFILTVTLLPQGVAGLFRKDKETAS